MVHIQFHPDHYDVMTTMTNRLKQKHPELTLYLDNVNALLHDWVKLIQALDDVTEEA